MTTLYKPVLIESAEQAEALPEGAIMFLPAGPYVWTARDPGGEFLDHYGRPWHFENTQDDEPFTALVPIEAEEEYKGFPMFPRPTDAPWPPRSTPNRDADGHWYYIDEDGYSTAHLGGHPFHDLMVAWIDSLPRTIRYVTPWESV